MHTIVAQPTTTPIYTIGQSYGTRSQPTMRYNDNNYNNNSNMIFIRNSNNNNNNSIKIYSIYIFNIFIFYK